MFACNIEVLSRTDYSHTLRSLDLRSSVTSTTYICALYAPNPEGHLLLLRYPEDCAPEFALVVLGPIAGPGSV